MLRPGPDGLTAEQELLAIAHSVLDDGRDHCPACHELVQAATFCSECGHQLHDAREMRKCPTEGCGYQGIARFCPRDGARIIPLATERVESGASTWNQEIANAWEAARDKLPPESPPAQQARDLAAMMGG